MFLDSEMVETKKNMLAIDKYNKINVWIIPWFPFFIMLAYLTFSNVTAYLVYVIIQ